MCYNKSIGGEIMAYTPRTTQPSNDDLRWRSSTYGRGGYNNFPSVKDRWPRATVYPYVGSVLANCTGYCAGRWMELGNTNTPYAFYGNANDWVNEAQGHYEVGTEPKLGAILCLSGYNVSGSVGHVAIVEEIYSNGDILCSESNFGGPTFEMVHRYKSLDYARSTYSGSLRGLLGFIYHPNITPSQPVYNVTVIGGTATPSSGHKGDVLGLTANVPNGYKFVRWTVSGAGTVTSPTLASTTFTVGEGDATITAVLAKKSSGMNLMFYISPPVYRRH